MSLFEKAATTLFPELQLNSEHITRLRVAYALLEKENRLLRLENRGLKKAIARLRSRSNSAKQE